MGNENDLLVGIIVGVFLCLCAQGVEQFVVDWCRNRERAKVAKGAKEDRDINEYRSTFVASHREIRADLDVYLANADGNASNVTASRSAAELHIQHIELLLEEQHKLGFVTSGSELDVLLRRQMLNREEESFITARHYAQTHAEKARGKILELEKLSARISAWLEGKSPALQEAALWLIEDLWREQASAEEKIERILESVEKNPVGIDDKRVTPGIREFRAQLEFARINMAESLPPIGQEPPNDRNRKHVFEI